MFGMGDSYPHSTSKKIFVIMDMLGFYLSIREIGKKSEIGDGWATLSTMSYLDYADRFLLYSEDDVADFDN